MKAFEFRLERPLKLKRQQQWLAEQAQLKAQANLDIARNAVVQLQEQLTQIALLLNPNEANTPDALSWMMYQQQSVLVGRQLEAAEVRAKQAERKVEEANAERVRITTEVEALAHLREQQLDIHRREVAKVRQHEVDEISLRRWLTQKARRDSGEQGETP